MTTLEASQPPVFFVGKDDLSFGKQLMSLQPTSGSGELIFDEAAVRLNKNTGSPMFFIANNTIVCYAVDNFNSNRRC